MNNLCWLGKHDYKVYHRKMRMYFQTVTVPSSGEDVKVPVYELKPVHKCKRCGKKVYEY